MGIEAAPNDGVNDPADWTKEHFAHYLAERGGYSYEDALRAIERVIASGKMPSLRPNTEAVN